MAVNLFDSAYELEKAVRESDEYKALKQAYDDVNADPSAKAMFDNFRKIQMELQQKQMMGQDITQEEVEQAQKTVALVQQTCPDLKAYGSRTAHEHDDCRNEQNHHEAS